MLTVMSFLVQLSSSGHRPNRRRGGEPDPYPVVAVVDNRVGTVGDADD